MIDDDDDTQNYIVLINDEEQYSLWPKHLSIPAGWHAVGPEGTKEVCLRYIEDNWIDMRPASLRRKMEASQVAAQED